MVVICLTGKFSAELEQEEEVLLDEDEDKKDESLLDVEDELDEDVELEDEELLEQQPPVDFGFSSRRAVRSGLGGTVGSGSVVLAGVLVTRGLGGTDT